ncbi:MAG: hypothetical protein ACJAXX_002133 [Roseivirga sp.]|jgi:hypothetical protein
MQTVISERLLSVGLKLGMPKSIPYKIRITPSKASILGMN